MPDTPETDAINWLLSLPMPPRRRWWHHDYNRGRVLDLAPIEGDPYGIMRWPDGEIWTPRPQPSWISRLLRRAYKTDARADARLAASQVRGLARHVNDLQRERDAALITTAQAEAWAARTLTDDDLDRLGECIPHSSIPEAISTIVDGWKD